MILNEEMKQSLMNKIIEKLNPSFIILFGSFAKGNANEESDVDLAFFSERKLSSYERFIFENELANIVNREVDLIDIKEIDTIFNMQIFSNGKPIYIQDENEFVKQRMRAYSMYVTLNEQRAPIIEAIKKRGSVFGDE